MQHNHDYSGVAEEVYKISSTENQIYIKNIFKNVFNLNSNDYIIRIAVMFNRNFGNIRYGVTRTSVFLKNLQI